MDHDSAASPQGASNQLPRLAASCQPPEGQVYIELPAGVAASGRQSLA